MPNSYNTTGGHTGVSGTGRAYTPQVTPWERDDDDSVVNPGRDGDKTSYTDRPSPSHEAASDTGQTHQEGDVWNAELTPSPQVTDRQDHDARDAQNDAGTPQPEDDNLEEERDPRDAGFFGRASDGLSPRER